MHCANTRCNQHARDLRGGTLRLVELDVPPEDRIVRGDGGFPVCSVPSKYFWLCAECSKLWTIERWTPTGLLLAPCGSNRSLARPVQPIRHAATSTADWPSTMIKSA